MENKDLLNEKQSEDSSLGFGSIKDRLKELDVGGLIKNLDEIAFTSHIKCVVPISGGKDSQSCLKLALERFNKDEVLGVFCDTNYEHPYTYSHVDKMRSLYGVQIVHINDGGVYERIKKYGRFPSDIARFCTDELKIRTAKIFYTNLAKAQGKGFEVWYGMRLGESYQRSERYKGKNEDDLYAPDTIMVGKYPKYLAKQGVMFRLPILKWEVS